MNEETLQALIDAWRANGDPRLVSLIMEGALAIGSAGAALEVAREISADDLPLDARIMVARVCLMADDSATALAVLTEEHGEAGVVRAHALAKSGDGPAARALYDAIIADNPTLEDETVTAAVTEATRTKAVNVVSLSDHWQSRKEGHDGEDHRPLVQAVYNDTTQRVNFADVGGLEEVKTQIRRKIITPFKKPSLFQKYRRKSGGGVLLYGPPGCGKTLLARATAGECEARFINVHIAEILDMFVGESEKRLAAVFEEARRDTPCVIFFDELEALAARRSYGSGETRASLVSTFLSELDGFDTDNEGVLVLAATNVPWAVDPAFRRPGRFDRLQFVPPPDREAREAILKLLLKDRPGAEQIEVRTISEGTGGFSGADLENLVNTAVDLAIESSLEASKEMPLEQKHFDQARKEISATTLEWLSTARNYAKYSNVGGQYDDVARFLERYSK